MSSKSHELKEIHKLEKKKTKSSEKDELKEIELDLEQMKENKDLRKHCLYIKKEAFMQQIIFWRQAKPKCIKFYLKMPLFNIHKLSSDKHFFSFMWQSILQWNWLRSNTGSYLRKILKTPLPKFLSLLPQICLTNFENPKQNIFLNLLSATKWAQLNNFAKSHLI